MKWDLFISHASEDKKDFVDPLAVALRRDRYRVWYDDFALEPGDSLRRSIDHGLTESAVGVVVLSPNFFRKEWPQRELDALTAQQIAGGKRLIPIWWKVSSAEVAAVSPLLADRIAIIAAKGFDHVLSELKRLINSSDKCTDRELDDVVARFFDHDVDAQRLLQRRCLSNFSKLVSYYNAYEKRIDEIVDNFEGEKEDNLADAKDDDELAEARDEELAEACDGLMQPWFIDALRIFDIPGHVYLNPSGRISHTDAQDIDSRLIEWCDGTMGQFRSAELLYDLDEWLDADCLFVLFGVPNFRVSPTQRDFLCEAVGRIGSRAVNEVPAVWDELYELISDRRRRGNFNCPL